MSRSRVALVAAIAFAVALGVRGLYLAELAPTPYLDERELIADTAYYDMRAREIAAGDWLGDAPAYLSPFYCLFLGLVYAASGPSLLAAKAVQAVLGALSCVLVYSLARRLVDERAARVAAALLALYGPHVYYGGILFPDTLNVLLHLGLAALLVAAPRPWTAPAAGVLAGLAVLTKENAILLALAIAVLWLRAPRGEPRSRRLLPCALFLVATAATIAPVTIANWRLSSRLLLVTTTAGENLLKGNGPTATGTHTFLPLGTQATGLRAHLDHRVDGAEAVDQSRAMAAAAQRHVLENPLGTLGLAAKKIVLLLNAHELGVRDHYAFARTELPLLGWPLLQFWGIVPLGLTGLLFVRGSEPARTVFRAVLGVQAVSLVLVFVLARYRLVAVAFLVPFAAGQLVWLVDRARESAWRRIALAGAVVGVLLALAFLPALARDRGLADQHKFLADRAQAATRHAEAVEHYRAALDRDWQDGRRSLPLRFECMLGLTRSLVALDRVAEALAILEQLSDEVGAEDPAVRAPLEQEIEGFKDALIQDR